MCIYTKVGWSLFQKQDYTVHIALKIAFFPPLTTSQKSFHVSTYKFAAFFFVAT